MSTAPLPEPIESTLKHDPYINGKFIEIFDHPDNAEIARAFTVGLPMNDPPRKEEAPAQPSLFPEFKEAPASAAVGAYEPEPSDHVVYTDKDGDTLDGLYSESDCEEHGRESAVYLATNEVVCIPHEHLPALIRWLQSRYEKGEEARGAAPLP